MYKRKYKRNFRWENNARRGKQVKVEMKVNKKKEIQKGYTNERKEQFTSQAPMTSDP